MNPRNTAIDVLTKIAGYDPRCPKPSTVGELAWAEQLNNIDTADALQAVTDWYTNDHAPMPLPGDIATLARTAANARRNTRRSDLIAACRSCDDCGWILGADGAPVDPAARCGHADAIADSD